MATKSSVEFEPRNEITIVGRLSAEPEERELPSGDLLVTCRVVVPRGDGKVDTLDCTAWSAASRKRLLSWQAGDIVEVQGALHRRFWRGTAGQSSRYEIEVGTAKRVARAA